MVSLSPLLATLSLSHLSPQIKRVYSRFPNPGKFLNLINDGFRDVPFVGSGGGGLGGLGGWGTPKLSIQFVFAKTRRARGGSEPHEGF